MMAQPMQKPGGERLLLPPAADYLGQWLLVLQEHYPSSNNELTPLAVAGYRLALAHLNERQIDLAFSETLKRHASNFRPAAGQILAYLREARHNTPTPAFPELPDAAPSEQDQKEIVQMIRDAAAKLGRSAASAGVVEITGEMRARHEEKTREARERYGRSA